MGLTKLGKYIALSDLRNTDNLYTEDDVVGISTQKMMINTKADLMGVSLTSYKLMPPGCFAYVPDTSRRGDKISLAFNSTQNTYLVSSISVVFSVNKPDKLSSDYLFMYFNRPEFDRYARFNSWGSAREAFSWDDMCDIEIELPPLPIQQKYVDIYNAMLANQRAYETGLENLKLVCDSYIDNNIKSEEYHKLGDYIEINEDRNAKEKFVESDIRGFNVDGDFIDPKRTFAGDIKSFRVIKKFDFVYNPRIPNIRFPIAVNIEQECTMLVSPAYVTFNISKKQLLDAEYLIMILQRENFSRKVLFNTWGSSTPFLRHEDLCEIDIPVPDLKIQKSITCIYSVYKERKSINEKLKAKIKDLCPILIKGSLDEAKF